MPPMRMKPKPTYRQSAFFMLAVLLPSAVLLSFGVVLVRQEAELNSLRLEDVRTFAARDVADSLFQALELAATSVGDPFSKYSDSAPRLLRLGTSRDGSHTFFRNAPVEQGIESILEPGFQEFLRVTDREVLIASQIAATIGKYESRLARESDPARQAFLELRIARALDKVGASEASTKWDRKLLARPSAVTDEYGNPMAYYAALRLSKDASHADTIADRLQQDLTDDNWMSSAALLFLDDLVSIETSDFRQIREEQALIDFLEDRPALMQQTELAGASWFALNDLPWVIRRVAIQDIHSLVAVHQDDLPLGIRTGTATSEDDRALGPFLANLVVSIDAASLHIGSDQRKFLIAGLILVIGLTLFGGYLLWRDVRRDTHISQLRTQFVSSVSHELRTPLTSIRLFAEALLSHGGENKAERDRCLSIIANESERLTRMLNNVLNTSRIERGTMTYHMEYGEMSEIALRAADTMEYAFKQANMDLKVEMDTVWTRVDPDALEQALINLLQNALKYASTGKSVSLSCVKNGQFGKFVVADHGPGISKEDHEQIFERFYRAEREDDRRVSGAGLGLSLVQHIAEGHDGKVSVESAPGHGATFTISIPITAS